MTAKRMKKALELLTPPVVYTVFLWGMGMLGVSEDWVVIGIAPLVVLLAYRMGVLRFRLHYKFGIRDGLVILLIFAAAWLIGKIFPTEARTKGFLKTMTAVIIAPVNEEVIFRVLVIERKGKDIGDGEALFVTSLLFSVAHTQPIPAFVVGMLLGALYLRYRSITVPLLVHMLLNLSTLSFQ